MAVLNEHKPQFSLAHLIKERYPTFTDALADLDDPLSMCHLFAALPSNVVQGQNAFNPEKAFDCERLVDEFALLCIQTHALRKVFVSIKGTYYQARIQNVDITWLVPHTFNQALPDDVDYRVMLTFLQFYAELLRFTNLKLYHDKGLAYPPALDQSMYESRAGFKSLQLAAKAPADAATAAAKAPTSAASAAGAPAPVDAQAKKALQKSVAAVVSKLKSKGKKGKTAAAADVDAMADVEEPEAAEEAESKEANADEDEFAKLSGSDAAASALANKTPAELDAYHAARVFEGMTFLLSREVPHASLEFVILCGGGKVENERNLSETEVANARFTHQIVDRPVLRGKVLTTREYVQPQWVYDSFNSYHAVPVASYAPGVVPPPHLSPFVKEEEEAELEALPAAGEGTVYVPKQRAVLQAWGAKASWLKKKQNEFDAAAEAAASSSSSKPAASAEDDAVDAELEAQEAQHARELALERKGKSHSAHVEEQAQKKAAAASKKGKGKKAAAAAQAASSMEDDADEEEQDGDDAAADDSEGEGDIVPDSEDDEDEEEEAEAAPAASLTGRKRKGAESVDANAPEELAKAMMTKKNKRLHTRMMYGIDKKKEAVEKLHEKREKAEKAEKQAQKKQKTAASNKKQ